ncbi:hypothetical protein Bca4012_041857 [Brassica carinata]
MKARMDSQQVRLDSLEDLLDVMAVGNPVMQRMLSERRAALGRSPRVRSNPSTAEQPHQLLREYVVFLFFCLYYEFKYYCMNF